jgi:MFS family permease
MWLATTLAAGSNGMACTASRDETSPVGRRRGGKRQPANILDLVYPAQPTRFVPDMSRDRARMTPVELRASLGLASVGGLRMLGMFIILPVFALYAERLRGGDSHTLIGFALGAYGLTQALLQFPFGWLSDHWGRKRTIYLGLSFFALGSFIAAAADDIYLVILGRVVQGAGAVSAAVIALAADLTRDDQRTKAMAIIGMTIGATFALSLIAGPVLGRFIGVPGIFALTGVLALSAMGVVRWVVPDPAPRASVVGAPAAVRFGALLRNPDLARLDWGMFVLHAVLMALFVVVPFNLRKAGLAAERHWQIYLPVMIVSVVLMLPPMLASERRGRQKTAFLAAVGVLLAAQVILAAAQGSLPGLVLGLVAFFAAFNLLEASLPALISRLAPAGQKGAAVGIFTSLQFLGAFAGATAGGVVSQYFGSSAVFVLCGLLTLSWLLVAWPMSAPATVSVRT